MVERVGGACRFRLRHVRHMGVAAALVSTMLTGRRAETGIRAVRTTDSRATMTDGHAGVRRTKGGHRLRHVRHMGAVLTA